MLSLRPSHIADADDLTKAILIYLNLGLDIKILILSFLSIEDALAFLRTSKHAYGLFDKPEFWRERFRADFPWADKSLTPSKAEYQRLYRIFHVDCRVMAANVWAEEYLTDCQIYAKQNNIKVLDWTSDQIGQLRVELNAILAHDSKVFYVETVNNIKNKACTENEFFLSATKKANALSAASINIPEIMALFNFDDIHSAVAFLIGRYISCGCHTLFRKLISSLDSKENYTSYFTKYNLGYNCMAKSIFEHRINNVRALIDAESIVPINTMSQLPFSKEIYSPLKTVITALGLLQHFITTTINFTGYRRLIFIQREIDDLAEIIDFLLQTGADPDIEWRPKYGYTLRQEAEISMEQIKITISSTSIEQERLELLQLIISVLQEKIVNAKPLNNPIEIDDNLLRMDNPF